MADSTLVVRKGQLRDAVSRHQGYGNSAPAGGTTDGDIIDGLVDDGQRKFYFGSGYDWSFLKPIQSISVWPTTASTLDEAPAAIASTVSGTHTATITLTVAEAIFTVGMIGETVTIDGTDNTIIGFTSSTVVTISTAITKSSNETVTVNASTVTVDDATFYDSGIGHDLTIDTTDYQVLTVTSTLVAIVSGIATAHANETATTMTADGDYRLPDNYGGINGRITFSGSTIYPSISIGSENDIRSFRQTSNPVTGRPIQAAITPLASDGSAGQRFALSLYPAPEQLYTLKYQVNILPDSVTTNEQLYGGAQHGLTIKEACLSEAEQQGDRESGIHTARYQELLRASIARDGKDHAPDTLGYNYNPTNQGQSGRRCSYIQSTPVQVLYNGTNVII